MKYLVMECHESYCVLLDDDGRFHHAANLHYEVGETVTHPVLMRVQEEPEKQARFSLKFVLTMAVAMCLLLVSVPLYSFYQLPYISFLLTINPSVRIEMSRSGHVVRVEGANEDGIILVKGYSAKGKDRWMVTDELIERAIDLGFLAEGGKVTIEIDAPENAVYTQTSEEAQQHYQQWTETHQKIQIQIHDVDDEEHLHDIVIDFDELDDDFDDWYETDDRDSEDDFDDDCDDYDKQDDDYEDDDLDDDDEWEDDD